MKLFLDYNLMPSHKSGEQRVDEHTGGRIGVYGFILTDIVSLFSSQFFEVSGRRYPRLLLEHPAEMLGILEAKFVGDLRDGCTSGKLILRHLDDVLANMVAGGVARHFLEHVAEVVGRHTELIGAILHGGKPSVSCNFSS